MKSFLFLLLACLITINVQAQQYCNASLSLDGIDDYGSISESFFSDPGERTFTMEFYVKSLGNTDPIPGIWGQYGTSSYLAVFNMSGIRFSYLNNGQSYSTDSTINTIDEWEHIAITGNEQNGELIIFKNGVKIGERAHGTPDWEFIDNSSRIGAILDIIGLQETYYYHGLIDDFHVSDSVLYTQDFTPPTQIIPNPRTRVLYNFNSINGSVIQDLSSNNNDLTLHNGAQLSQDVPHPGGAGIITQEPTNQYPDFGTEATFVLSASGQVLYKWYVNTGNGFQPLTDNAEYAGTQTTQLTIKQADPSYNTFWYRCIVQRGVCADTSNQVRVFVCGKISQQPSNVNAISVDTGSFTINHSDINALYLWQYSNGSGFISIIDGINYTGATLRTLRVNKRGLGKGPHIYRCIVQSGVCSDTTTIANLFVCGSLITQPIDVQGVPNISYSFSVNHSDPQASYQWLIRKKQNFERLIDGNGIMGSTSARVVIDTARYSMNRWSFRCIVSSGICNDTSSAGTLYLCGSITNQPIAPTNARPGTTIQLRLIHSDQDARCQWQKYDTSAWINMNDGVSIMGAKSSTMFISNISTKDHGYQYRCITNSVICSDTSIPIRLSVCGNIIDQPVAIRIRTGESASTSVLHSDIHAQYQWQSAYNMGFSNLINIGDITGANTQTITFNKLSLSDHNRKLRCIIFTGGCIDTTSESLISVCGRLKSQPANSSVKQGQPAMFNIFHEDSEAAFQWQKMTNDIPYTFVNIMNDQQYFGVRNDTLLIMKPATEDSGSVYRCLITTNGCFDTSDIAKLSVISDPMSTIDEHAQVYLSIHPHPVTDMLHVMGLPEDAAYRLRNILGKDLMNGIMQKHGYIDVSSLPKGLYYLHIGLLKTQTITFLKE